jgi:hypothetical protein
MTDTITIPARDLHRIIADTHEFASASPEYPPLTAIQLRSAADYLTACATDRFAIAWSRTRHDIPDGFHAGLPRESVPAWLALLDDRYDPATITITRGAREQDIYLTLKCGSASITVDGMRPLPIHLAGIMEVLLKAEPTDAPGMRIDPTRLAPFTNVAVRRQPPAPSSYYDDWDDELITPGRDPAAIAIQGIKSTGELPMLRVTIDEDFIGCLMGVRHRTHGIWEDVTFAEHWRAIVRGEKPESDAPAETAAGGEPA